MEVLKEPLKRPVEFFTDGVDDSESHAEGGSVPHRALRPSRILSNIDLPSLTEDKNYHCGSKCSGMFPKLGFTVST